MRSPLSGSFQGSADREGSVLRRGVAVRRSQSGAGENGGAPRATAGLEPAPDWLDVKSALSFFHPDHGTAQADYREFVLAKIGVDDCLWDKLMNGIFLGTEEWARKVRKIVETEPRSTDHPRTQRAVGRPKMHEIVDAVGKAACTTAASIRETRGSILRSLASWIGWHQGLITLRSIAAGLRLRTRDTPPT